MASMERFKNLTALLNYHFRLHEGMQVEDIYKLMHQSVFGPEHLDAAASENSIAEEMNNPDVRPVEPLLEPISVDSSAGRINLRVARHRRIAPALIAKAVRLSMDKFSRNHRELSRLCDEAGDSLKNVKEGFSREDFDTLTRMLDEKGFPPLHHSRSYRELNRPAYRVIMKVELRRLMQPS